MQQQAKLIPRPVHVPMMRIAQPSIPRFLGGGHLQCPQVFRFIVFATATQDDSSRGSTLQQPFPNERLKVVAAAGERKDEAAWYVEWWRKIKYLGYRR
jgi:hypothetical protein